MALRLKLLSAIVAGLLLGCSSGSSSSPSHRVGSDYPVPQGPASINAHDAGSYPHLALTVSALPECDGGNTYLQQDGGPPKCGTISGGGGSFVAAGCDAGGAVVRGAGADAGYQCVPQGLGVNSVSGTTPITVSGPGYAPVVAISAATDSTAGSMSSSDKTKLDGIGSGANVASVTGSGIASASPTTGAVVVTVAAPSLVNHGTGADLSSCTTSQLVEGGSSALSCITISGDCVYTAGGGVICGKANAGSGGELDFGATTGTISAASGATAPGLAQASESTTQTPTPMVDVPQVSTHATNQDGSSRGFALSALAGSGAPGQLFLDVNSVRYWTWGDDGSGHVSAWAGIPAGTETATNTEFWVSSGFHLRGGGEAIYLEPGGSTSLAVFASEVDTGGNLGVGPYSAGGNYGGGTNVVYLKNGTATSSACTGGTCLDSIALVAGAGSGLTATSSAFDVDTLQPVTGGTHNTQALTYPQYRWQDSATTSHSPNYAMTIPTGAVCGLSYRAVAKCTNSLGVCNAAGTGYGATYTVTGATVHNVSGTAVVETGTPAATVSGGNTGFTCALAASTNTITLTCGDLSNAQTSDWIMWSWLTCD